MNEDIIQRIIKEKQNDSWWLEAEKEVVKKYGEIFSPANLDNLTAEDFKSFLLFKNNRHWVGIHRHENRIISDMPKLRNYLKRLLDEEIPIHERLEELFDKKNKLYIKGLGKAVLTPLLLVVYPQKYGVWNARSEEALKELNLFPQFKSKDSFADKYIKINNVLNDLATQYNINLWLLDGVFGQISGLSPFEVKSDEETIEEEAEEHGIEDVVAFGMEKHLEDFIIDNWEKTVFGEKYILLEEEGDIESQQYPTAVGPIDILAKSRDTKEYLIIELKKRNTTDAVVGQLLRYMAWVKENLADGNPVKGAIVVLNTDEKLKYSLKELPNVTLYTYEVNFKLNKENIS